MDSIVLFHSDADQNIDLSPLHKDMNDLQKCFNSSFGAVFEKIQELTSGQCKFLTALL